MSVSRLFEMLYILLERERVTASELAGRLEVSVRTVYRDAQALSEAGVPVYAERGREGGLAILPGYKLSKSVLSDRERADVLAALEATARTGASEAATLRKLRAFLGGSEPDWVRIDFADWSGRRDALLAALKEAILARRMLTFDYYGESGALRRRTVCPLRLWFKGGAWYLLAYCMDRRALRTFKLTRIQRAQSVPGLFPPEATQQREPPQDAPAQAMQRVELLADACMAYRVFDDFEEEEIEPLAGGGYHIRAAFPPGAWIVSMILSYGAHAQVLAPQALREEVEKTLQKMLGRYQS